MSLVSAEQLHHLIDWDKQSLIHWWVAYSGGMDSQALLYQLYQLYPAYQKYWRIHAVHVHHGLHHDANEWLAFCQAQCLYWNIDFTYHRVSLNQANNIEAQARNARYQKLKQHLKSNQCYLLTAHHLDDQIETFQLQLLRGAGIDGLASMPKKKTLAKGKHIRPLLDYPREKIYAYAKKAKLKWIDDPSNRDIHFSRNYLRHHCNPIIEQRWPSYRLCVNRSINHIQKQQQLLNQYIQQDLALAMNNQSQLCINVLKSWSDDRILVVLRAWLQYHQASMPNQSRLNSFHTLLSTNNDTAACIVWGQHSIRRYRSKLYYCKGSHNINPPSAINWPAGQHELQLPKNMGRLVLQPAQSGLRQPKPSEHIQVRFNTQHQTRLYWHGQKHHRSLKDMYQSHGVPPWQRPLTPAIYYNESIVALIPYGIVDQYYSNENALQIQLIKQ